MIEDGGQKIDGNSWKTDVESEAVWLSSILRPASSLHCRPSSVFCTLSWIEGE
jgi:hypothetical protein